MKRRPARRPRLVVEQLEDRTTPATVTVTTLLDVVSQDADTSSPAALSAAPGSDGVISLREAIIAAEADAAADAITFDPSLAKGTVTLTQFDTGIDDGEAGPSSFNVATPITVVGSGQVLTRGVEAGDSRLFFVTGGGNLTLENLELTGGFAGGGHGNGGGGGAAGLGGAVFNMGTLTLRNSVLDGNAARGGDGGAFDESVGGGGGLGESSNSELGGEPNGGTFSGPRDGGFGGGGAGGSESAGGHGGFGGGGGAGLFGGTPGNGGFGGGGGGSTNQAGSGGFGGAGGSGTNGGGGAGLGGAVFNLGGTVNVVNSTITGNTAAGGFTGGEPEGSRGQGLGAGLFNLNGTVNLVQATIINNTVTDGAGTTQGGDLYVKAATKAGGVPGQTAANTSLANAIVGVVTEDHGDVANTQSTVTFAGKFANAAGGYVELSNGDGTDTTASAAFTAARLVTSAVPVSITLADNGGPTRTLALTPDSEAADVGDNAAAVDPVTNAAIAFDQRGTGFARVNNGTVDLGAFETQVASPPATPDTVVFTSTNAVVITNGPEGAPPLGDPYPQFAGGNRVAVADVNRDGVPDYVFSPGFGGGPHVRVISGATGAQLYSFFAYEEGFRGGTFVALGDFNGDGFADVVTGAGLTGALRVRVFSGRDLTTLADFYAYGPAFRGGVAVAAGDVNGDGTLDVVTGPGLGEGNAILVIDGTKLHATDGQGLIQDGAIYTRFLAAGPEFVGGVAVAAGDLDGDRFADVVAGPLAARTPRLLAFRGSDLQLAADRIVFPPPALDTGLRLAVADRDGDGIDEVFAIAGPGGGPHTVVLNPFTGEVIENLFTFDPTLRTGFDVG